MIKPKIPCPSCGGERTRVNGTHKLKTSGGKRCRYLCDDCNHRWSIWYGAQPRFAPSADSICPACGNQKSRIRNSYRSKTCDSIRRLRVCSACSHRWTTWEGEKPDPRVYSKRNNPSALTEQQIRMVLTERTLTQTEIARRIGKSRSTVQRIRSGQLYADRAPELPRIHRKVSVTCSSCVHCIGSTCRMDIPDFLDEGKTFAVDCDLYEMKQLVKR